MNVNMMADYVEVIADRLLVALNLSPIFNKKNPVRTGNGATRTSSY